VTILDPLIFRFYEQTDGITELQFLNWIQDVTTSSPRFHLPLAKYKMWYKAHYSLHCEVWRMGVCLDERVCADPLIIWKRVWVTAWMNFYSFAFFIFLFLFFFFPLFFFFYIFPSFLPLFSASTFVDTSWTQDLTRT